MKTTGVIIPILMAVLGVSKAFCADPAWHYEDQAEWGALEDSDPSVPVPQNYPYSVCGIGRTQSPVDLTGKNKEIKSYGLVFKYQKFAADFVNNGHAVQEIPLENDAYRGKLLIGRLEYPLIQFHFHTPSEHVMNGRQFPAELHFVHIRDDGKAAVVGVLIEEGSKPNATLQTIIDNTPKEPGENPSGVVVDPWSLLPNARKKYTTYAGSLTTPPCSEGINWYVLERPISATAQQIEQLRSLEHDNHRLTQPLNGRMVVRN
jgi:carbonic anhydrase